ncbi:MAG TPA: MgtC/SapB family protein [Pirellulales bacterium]|nr:MgtC/SapB family protein [Pirellulales bacterium]
MSTDLGWDEIALRLALTVVAGGLVGLDRGEHGRAAGLRTTILVCLAASASMIEANLLLPTAGKAPDSFVVLDLMRLPLGILSGMGFIGAGAILRRGKLVRGVTTAATLWFVTVMGLCFGGGQKALGLVLLAIGLTVLAVLRWVEHQMREDRQGTLILAARQDGPSELTIREELAAEQFSLVSFGVTHLPERGLQQVRCQVRWRARGEDSRTPQVVGRLAAAPGVIQVRWQA